MNIIEELKLIIEEAGEAYEYMHNLKVVSVSALESLIEEYKNAQEPVAWFARRKEGANIAFPATWIPITKEQYESAEFNIPELEMKVHFTHPPLSDETVKDAERWRHHFRYQDAYDNQGIELPFNGTITAFFRDGESISKEDVDEEVDKQIALLDEAMKADNVPK